MDIKKRYVRYRKRGYQIKFKMSVKSKFQKTTNFVGM